MSSDATGSDATGPDAASPDAGTPTLTGFGDPSAGVCIDGVCEVPAVHVGDANDQARA